MLKKKPTGTSVSERGFRKGGNIGGEGSGGAKDCGSYVKLQKQRGEPARKMSAEQRAAEAKGTGRQTTIDSARLGSWEAKDFVK